MLCCIVAHALKLTIGCPGSQHSGAKYNYEKNDDSNKLAGLYNCLRTAFHIVLLIL